MYKTHHGYPQWALKAEVWVLSVPWEMEWRKVDEAVGEG